MFLLLPNHFPYYFSYLAIVVVMRLALKTERKTTTVKAMNNH